MLSPHNAHDRIRAWRDQLANAVERIERPVPTCLKLHLRAESAQLVALMTLAEQEKACCGFLSFSFVLGSDGLTLVIEVPGSAVATLDDFAALAPSQDRSREVS
jgi:hypothetical protein